MKNEANFLIVIVITIFVLMFYPMLMKRFLPQYFPEKGQQTQEITGEERQETVLKKQDLEQTKHIARPAPRQSNLTYSKQKSYVIRNNRFEVIVNSPRADIESIKLLKFKEPANRKPTVLMDTKNSSPGIFADVGLVENATLENVDQANNSLSFQYKHSAGLIIKKTIMLDDESYVINLSITIENLATKEYVLPYRVIAATGIKNVGRLEGRYNNQIALLENQKKQKRNISGLKEQQIPGKVQLSGFMLRYFSLVMVPLVTTDFTYSYKLTAPEGIAPVGIGIGVNRLVVPAKGIVKQHYKLYAGPNDQVEMSRPRLGIEEIRGKGFFAGLSDLLLLLLRWLHKLLKNYGLAVIGLALTINLFLYPLTFKSLKSMKEMQALQPLVEKIRNEHKDNPQKLNKEIMELYRKHKVNPAGGCLPMLLQMPVFFSLYGVLMRAIELRGASFLWIKDLASPDAFISFPAKLPLLGSSLNILPLIMMVFSFFQQKLTSPGQINDQQKAMAFMMPILLGVIFYNFPSGLVLYFLTNSIFSVVIQAKISKPANLIKA